MKISDRDRRAVIVGLAALAVLAVVQFALRPWIADWQDARARLAAGRTELAALSAQIHRIETQRRRLVDVLGEAATRPLPEVDKARIDAVHVVENVLKAGPIKIASVRPQPARPLRDLSGVTMLSFHVQGKGRFDQIAKAIDAVRSTELLLLVDGVSVTAGARGGNELDLSMTLVAPARESLTP